MPEQLARKTLRGILWSLAERGGSQVIQLIVFIVLARLLMPEDFGLIAIVAVFVAISTALADAGFSSALIQKQGVTSVDESSIFYFNIVLSTLIAGTLAILAPWIAEFYENPSLTALTRVLSLNIIVISFGAIHIALLSKRVDFKTQSLISLTSAAIGGLAGIGFALSGLGVWSLVVHSVTSTLSRTFLLWLMSDWRPIWSFSPTSLSSMFPFGSRLLLASLLDTAFNNLYTLVIGKTYTAADVGFYSRAEQLYKVPVKPLTLAVNKVTFPAFSSIQEDKARLRKGVRKALTSLSLLIFPAMVGLAIVSEPLVRVLITDKWLPSVPYLQLFCILGILHPLHSVNLSVLKAQGRSDLFLRLEVIKKSLILLAIAITYRWGISAMIWGAIAVSCVGYYINAYFTGRFLGYSILHQIKDVGPVLVCALVAGVCVYPLPLIVPAGDVLRLALQLTLGTLIYLAICRLLRLRAFMETCRVLSSSSEDLRRVG